MVTYYMVQQLEGEGCPDGPVEAQTAGEGPPQELLILLLLL